MILLAVAFTLLAALLLWHLIGARGPWRVKLALIVLVPAYGWAVWHALDSTAGWPTDRQPPAAAQLLWGTVVEPTPQGGAGAIYLWLAPPSFRGVFAYRGSPGEPRAYRLPYSRQLHEQLQQALEQIRHGHPVAVGRAHGRGRGGAHSQRMPRSAIRFYRLPPPTPPEKTS